MKTSTQNLTKEGLGPLFFALSCGRKDPVNVKKLLSLSLVASFAWTGCSVENCTEEFAMITVEINGGYLDRTATVRSSTGDTVYAYDNPHDSTSLPPPFYVIIDDNYAGDLRDDQDVFTFFGWVNDSLVVQQNYLISADACHIDRESGPTQIDL